MSGLYLIQPSPYRKLWYIIPYSLIAILIIGIGTYIVLSHIKEKHNEQQLRAADKDVEALYQQFNKALPDATLTRQHYCAHDQEEGGFGGSVGALRCTTTFEVTQKFPTENFLQMAIKNSNDILNKDKNFVNFDDKSGVSSTIPLDSKRSESNVLTSSYIPYKNTTSDLNCHIYYELYHFDSTEVEKQGSFDITFDCTRYLDHPIYKETD